MRFARVLQPSRLPLGGSCRVTSGFDEGTSGFGEGPSAFGEVSHGFGEGISGLGQGTSGFEKLLASSKSKKPYKK